MYITKFSTTNSLPRYSRKAKPGFVVSADISIEEAPEYYQLYSHHLEDKIVIRFP